MRHADQSDEVLAMAAIRGDRAAFECLVRRSARWLFARLYLDTGDTHRAEDLVQETYLLAWRRIRELDDPAAFRAWLNRIAQTVAIDAARRESRWKRSAPLVPASELEHASDRTASPDDSAVKNESRRRVLEALRELPESYREPLILRYLAGADYATIGKQLAISNGSLRGLLHRGTQMLRDKLKEIETTDEEQSSPRVDTNEHE